MNGKEVLQPKIELVDINTLRPAEWAQANNPSTVQRLAESFGELGMLTPPTVSYAGTIIDGNHRIAAARYLGHTEVMVLRLNVTDEEILEIITNMRSKVPIKWLPVKVKPKPSACPSKLMASQIGG